ncbi:hypothetical protein ACJ41O_010233 [Fusarium nematophilum]
MGNSAQVSADACPPAYQDVVSPWLIVDHGDDERNHQNCTEPAQNRSPTHRNDRLNAWLLKNQFRSVRKTVARVEWSGLDNYPTHQATAESVCRMIRDLKRNTRELWGFSGGGFLYSPAGCPGLSGQPTAVATANTRPLQPGELEYSVDLKSDWTAMWRWEMFVQLGTYADHPQCSHWSIHMWVYLKDLPRELEDGGISWTHGGVEVLKDKISCNKDFVRGRNWVFVRHVVLRQSPTVQAEVMVRHWDRSRLREWDFRDMVSAENRARTKPGKFKRAVCFHQHLAYGNDVTGEHVECWKDEHRERFGSSSALCCHRSYASTS